MPPWRAASRDGRNTPSAPQSNSAGGTNPSGAPTGRRRSSPTRAARTTVSPFDRNRSSRARYGGSTRATPRPPKRASRSASDHSNMIRVGSSSWPRTSRRSARLSASTGASLGGGDDAHAPCSRTRIVSPRLRRGSTRGTTGLAGAGRGIRGNLSAARTPAKWRARRSGNSFGAHVASQLPLPPPERVPSRVPLRRRPPGRGPGGARGRLSALAPSRRRAREWGRPERRPLRLLVRVQIRYPPRAHAGAGSARCAGRRRRARRPDGGESRLVGGSYLEDEIGVTFLREPTVLELAGRRVFLAHGDGLGTGDLGYRGLRLVLRGSLTRWAFRWLHPDLGARSLAEFPRRSTAAPGATRRSAPRRSPIGARPSSVRIRPSISSCSATPTSRSSPRLSPGAGTSTPGTGWTTARISSSRRGRRPGCSSGRSATGRGRPGPTPTLTSSWAADPPGRAVCGRRRTAALENPGDGRRRRHRRH